MTSMPLPTSLTLARQGVATIDNARGVDFTCTEGSVWLTLDNDPRDYVLEAGDTFQSNSRGRAVLYAFAPSRIDLVERQSKKETMPTLSRFHAMPLMNAAR